ncbi:MAG: peptide ABC transporter substrate-binding protein [Bdellovibrionota bacterium]
MNKIITSTLVLFSIFFLALGCTKKQGQHPDYHGTTIPSHPANELWVNGAGEPQFMDPAKISEQLGSELSRNMFVRLTELHPVTSKPIPDLAYKWDISDDLTGYTFYIRQDAKWSDGTPLTAHDVEWSWKRVLKPETTSPYSDLFDVIAFARYVRKSGMLVNVTQAEQAKIARLQSPFIESKRVNENQLAVLVLENEADYQSKLTQALQENSITFVPFPDDLVGIKALDKERFEVKLNSPAPYFLGLITYVVFSPLPRHVIEKFAGATQPEAWTRPENIVVSGPFKLTQEEFKQYKLFEKNPLYYHADQVKIDKVKSIMIEDYTADIQAYETGQFDWSCCASIPTEMMDKVKVKRDFHNHAIYGTYYYVFNTQEKPFDDPRVRRALSLAVDRETIVEKVTRQGQLPTYNYIPSNTFYQGPKSKFFDPETAKKLLAEAGFPNGEGFPTFVLKYNTADSHKQIALAIQQMWKVHLGINVELVNMEFRVLMDQMDAKQFQMMRRGWIGDYMDPHAFASQIMSESGNNPTSWHNPTYDELVRKTDYEKDPDKRNALFYQAEEILNQEQPIMPIYIYTRAHMLKPYIKGHWDPISDIHEWKYISIDERWYNGVPEDHTKKEEEVPWCDKVTYQKK